MTEDLQEFLDSIQNAIGMNAGEFTVERDELTLRLGRDGLLDKLRRLKADPSILLEMLLDVTAIDWPAREQRFDVVYQLLSLRHNQRLRVKVAVGEVEVITSVGDIWPTAHWFEREAWDMYGIYFSGHPDLRRLLTDYGFDGHPLRKDFPLTGYVEVRYDEEQQRVVTEPVKLAQEFRTFDYASPWEGMIPDVRHGDEKAAEGGAN